MRSKFNLTVQEYTSLFQQGDEQGLEFFFLEFHAALSLFAHRLVQNRAVAEEIASEAFVKTWKMHGKLTTYQAIRAYLYKIVRRDSQRVLYQEARRNQVQRDSQGSMIIHETAHDQIVRAEAYRLVHAALKGLAPGNRRVISMHFIDGKTTGEIARELNLSPSTIKTQKTKGLEALRKKLVRPLLIILPLFLKIFFLPA